MMENKCKRFLSLLLAFVMVLGMFPAGHVHAEGETVNILSKPVTELQADAEYQLFYNGSRGVHGSVNTRGGFTGLDTGSGLSTSAIANDAKYIWTLKAADGGYRLYNAAAGKYAKLAGSTASMENEENSSVFVFEHDAAAGTFKIKTVDGLYFNNLGGQNIMGGYGSDAVVFTIRKVLRNHTHNAVDIPAVAPTLNSTGLTAGQECVDCGTVISGRETVAVKDYNDGIVPLEAITATAGSSERVNNGDGPADYAKDDNLNTRWHTQYSGGSSTAEQRWIEFAVDGAYDVTGLRYLGRNAGGNIHQYKITVSYDNGATYQDLTEGSWTDDGTWKEVNFETPLELVTNVRLRAVAARGNQHAVATEMRLVGEVHQFAEHVHTEEILDAVPVTIGADGKTEGKKCSECGEIILAQEVIPALYKSKAVPSGAFTATVGSYETSSATEGNADLALDDQLGTMWHTAWSGTARENLWFDFELTADYEVSGLYYKPRNGAHNGTIIKYQVLGSYDGESWFELTSGDWELNDSWKEAAFNTAKVKHVRLMAVESTCDQANKNVASAAEIRLVGVPCDHFHRYTVSVTDPTCTQNGTKTLTCTCGDTKTETIPAAHGTITHVAPKAATCDEPGNVEYWRCETCGKTWSDEACTQVIEDVTIPVAHQIIHVDSKAATCFEAGNIEYWYCDICFAAWLDEACTRETTLADVVIPITHNVLHVAPKAATCTEAGNIEYWYCADCGAAWLDAERTQGTNLQAVVLPITHNVKHVEAKAATCTEAGNIEYWYCVDCGQHWLNEACTQPTTAAETTIAIDSDAHNWGAWQTVTAATCTTKGSEKRVCAYNDEHVETQDTEIDANAHTYGTLVEAQPLVHTQTELKASVAAHYKCACGKYFTEGYVETSLVALTGETPVHTAGTPVEENRQEPTLNSTGSYDLVTYCLGCNKEMSRKTETIPALEGAVAEVGGIKFDTLAKAIAAGGEVTLLANVELTERLDVDKWVSLNLNGHTISGDFVDAFGMIYVKKNGYLILSDNDNDDGSIIANKTHAIGNYGYVSVEGGNIVTNADETYAGLYNFYYQADYYGSARILRGSVDSVFNCGVLTVSGGEVTYLDNSGLLDVLDGEINEIYARDGSDAPGLDGAGTITIADPANITVPEGFELVKIGEDHYQVVAKTYVAELNGEEYETLAAALSDAVSGNTVKLLADCAFEGTVPVGATLDLNGHKLIFNGIENLMGAGRISINGGTIVVKQGEEEIEMFGPNALMVKTDDGVLLMIGDGITMIEGTFNLDWPIGTMTVAGTAKLVVESSDTTFIYISLDSTTASVEGPEGLNVTTTQDGYEVVYENGTYTLVEKAPVVTNVAMIGEQGYATLAAAIADAQAGETILLLEEVTEEIQISDNAVVNLDLNGKTLNGFFKPFKGKLTVKNGSIVNTNSAYSAIEINAGELVLNNVNVTSARHAVRIDGAVTATIDGGEYKLNATKGTRHALNVSGAAVVTIKAGTFVGPKGTTMDSGSAVIAQTGANVIIEGGSFSGGKLNTLGGAGTITVSGGTFDQNPTARLAEGYCAKAVNGVYTVQAHNYKATVTEPTCEDDGYTTYTCEFCGHNYKGNEVPAPGHTWNEGVVTKAATCSAKGEKTFTCAVCGDSYTDEIPVDNNAHNWGEPTYAPTADNEKHVATYICANDASHTKSETEDHIFTNGDCVCGEKAPEVNHVAKIGEQGYASLTAAISAANAGDTITFLADITEDVTINKSVTIDGAGKTYTGQMKLTNKANITIKNVNFDGKGYNGYAVQGNGAYYITIEDCTAKGYRKYGFLQVASDNVSLNVKNVAVSDCSYGIKVDYNYDVTLENVDLDCSVAGLLNSNYGEKTITIKNSDISILGTWTRNNTTKTTYVFEGANSIDNFITDAAIDNFKLAAGATLTAPQDITVTTDVENHEVVYENGTYKLAEKKVAVAMIGEQGYETLAAAITAAKAGNTITFVADITENVTINKSVTIDGAGKTYTGQMKLTNKANVTIKNVNFDGKGFNGYAVEPRGASYVTIEDCTAMNYGYGFVQLVSATVLTTVKNVTVSNMNYGVKINYSNAVVLENVDITANVAAVMNSNYSSKTITIKDSKLSILYTWARNNTTQTTYVFEGANSIDQFVFNANLDNFKLAAGATLTAPNDITVTTDVKDMKVKYEDGTYKLVKAAIAKIGTVEYSTLQEAVDAATDGQIIKLICDAEGAGVIIDKNLTIDFANFTYTINEPVGSTGTESNGFQILAGNTVTLRNGTLKVADSAADKFYILIQNYADLKLNSITLDGRNLDKYAFTDGDSYVLSNNSGNSSAIATKIIVNDNGDKAVAFDVCKFGNYTEPTMNIKVADAIYVDETTLAVDYAKYVEAAAFRGNYHYATLQQAVDLGGTVTLFKDIAGPGVVIRNDVNINFANHTYTITEPVGSTGTESNGFQILKGTDVVFRNGTLKVADSAANKFYILVQNYSDSLSMSSMTLDGTNLDKYAFTDGDSYTLSNNSGNVNIGTGTKIIANNDGALAFAFDACDQTDKGYDLPVVTVHTRATIEGNIEAAAKIGNVYYANLQQAIDAAANGKTITLLKDIELGAADVKAIPGNLTAMINVAGKSLTLDMNGKTITAAYDASELLYTVIYVGDGASLTVKGEGKIDLITGDTKAGKYDCVAYMFLKSGDTGALNIENGTFTANKVEDSMIYTNGDKVVNIKGGNWTLGNVGTKTNGAPWIFNTKGQNERTILVSGGTYNFNVAKQYYAREVSIEDANGNLSYVIDNGDGTWTVSGKTAEVAIVTDTWKSSYLYGYATFKDAVASIAKGAPETTIRLLKNITVKGQFIGHDYAQKVVIDLNGYTMSSTDKTLTVYRAGTEVTVKNGTVYGNTTGGTIQTTYGGKLTLGENVTIKSGGSATALKVDANATLIVDQDTTYVLGGKNDLVVADGATVQISAGYFKKPVQDAWCAEGYVPTDKLENGYYSVMEDPANGMAAVINGTYYATLQEAIAAAATGDTITVLADIAVDTSAVVANSSGYAAIYNIAEKDITIDLNGKKIEATVNAADLESYKDGILLGVFCMDTNGKLTLTGEGTVTANLVDAPEAPTASKLYSLMTAYGAGSELVVENGTFHANSVNSSLVYSQYDEIVTINGGTYTLGNLGKGSNGSPWLFNAKGQNTQNILVNGGTFSADIQHQYYPFEVKMPKELALKKADGMFTVVPAVAYVNEQEWSSKWYTNYVGYATVEEAEAAAEGIKTKVVGKKTYYSDCEVVTLLVKEEVNLEDVLGGEIAGVDLPAGEFTLPSTSGDVSITGTKDTVITVNDVTAQQISMSGVTVKSSGAAYTGIKHSEEVVFNDCTIVGNMYLYAENVVFTNCTFDLSETNDYIWVYGAKNVTFKDCTFNTMGKAILVFQDGSKLDQTVTVEGCTFSASQGAYTWNGIHVAAVSMDGSQGGTYNVILNNNTVDFNFNGLWQDKTSAGNITVTVDGTTVLTKN